jgi:TetR/AcrR family fatty acid metabolism transcriptional regulator
MNVHSFTLMTVATTSRRSSPSRNGSPADKGETILKAATKVFAQKGFFNAQVADVARAAGIAAGTVYLYFRSKDELLTSIFERTMQDAIAESRSALDGMVDPVEKLRTLARLHLGRLGRDRDLAVVFQVELRQSTKFMERYSSSQLRTYLGQLRDAIGEAQAAGTFRKDINSTLAAKALFGALDEMATNWILSARRYALVTEADVVVDLIVNGMKKIENGEE